MRNVTIADVAKRAGISKAAAWAVLSGKKSTISVAAATRQRILQAADELGYQPDLTAKALSTKRSLLIGLFLRAPYRDLFVELLQGVQSVCDRSDYSVVTYTLGNSTEDQLRQLRSRAASRMDAAIVIPAFDASGRTSQQAFAELRQRGMPVVQLLGRILPGVPTSTVDFRQAGAIATQHLIELGHRRIMHVTRPGYRDEQMPGYFRILRERWEGYEIAMRRAGLMAHVMTVRESADGATYDARRLVDELQAHPANPTSIVAINDQIAWPLVRECLTRGIHVPGDMSVTGCDDDPVMVIGAPNLTTVRFPVFRIGEAAAEMAMALIDGRAAEDAVFSPELIVRESTAACSRF